VGGEGCKVEREKIKYGFSQSSKTGEQTFHSEELILRQHLQQ